MGSLLLIGLLLGMRHALEADHVAAVASLMNHRWSLRNALRQGGVWGLGHTTTLFLFGSTVIFVDRVIPEYLVNGLEMAVGAMLVLLGADVLRRIIRNKVHFHSHHHENGAYHFHAHSHPGESKDQHHASQHNHHHHQKFPQRVLLVGMMHGMAGSAAVIVLALGSVTSPMQGMLYILVFGVGSIIGMALLSAVISVPLLVSASRLTWMHNGLQIVIGVVTIGLGILMLFQNGSLLIS